MFENVGFQIVCNMCVIGCFPDRLDDSDFMYIKNRRKHGNVNIFEDIFNFIFTAQGKIQSRKIVI